MTSVDSNFSGVHFNRFSFPRRFVDNAVDKVFVEKKHVLG